MLGKCDMCGTRRIRLKVITDSTLNKYKCHRFKLRKLCDSCYNLYFQKVEDKSDGIL